MRSLKKTVPAPPYRALLFRSESEVMALNVARFTGSSVTIATRPPVPFQLPSPDPGPKAEMRPVPETEEALI